MALNIKNPEVERLAGEVASLAKESKTEAIRKALVERQQRLLIQGTSNKRERLESFLRNRVWPEIPKGILHRCVRKKQREKILGYGPKGF